MAGIDIISDTTGKKIVDAINALNRTFKTDTVYGFHIDSSEADPSAAVTYLRDAVGMTPAHMDYTNDKFDYGSWEDAFFMPRPCMLKKNGVVAYYLNPNDLTKKADGTDSDIANTAFEGNAMMEWGKDGKRIWLKVVPKGTDSASVDVYIANYQADSDYHAWSFMDTNGAYIDHFYTPIYNGSLADGVTRSISGQAVSQKLTAEQEIAYAQANGTGWMIENFGDRLLINYLLILMGKSLDTQGVFGQGITNESETALNAYTTGALNDKGLFYGSSSTNTAVKIFGTENYWGLQWRRTTGLVIQGGTIKYKLTESDADGASGGYTIQGSNYIDSGIVTAGTSGEYISAMAYEKDGAALPANLAGSSSTYYCDGNRFEFHTTIYALFGGPASDGASCGAFYLNLSSASSHMWWGDGAAVSCKPLA